MNRTDQTPLNANTESGSQALTRARHKRMGGGKLVLALAVAAASSAALAAPRGGEVIDGDANIHHGGNITDIDQHSQNITVVWDDFDIDADEIVNFLQPNSDSLALNRVFSADGTQINGQLNANGRVFVLDANGVLFGESAQVNVGSLVASTLDLSHSDYNADTFTFSGNGAPASVTNLGEITAADTGAVALLGGQVTNRGVIRAQLGNVALAAGNQVTLDFAGDGLLNVQVDEAALNALAENHGLIQANGGQVLMTAHASDALLQTVVNNTGVIEAQTLAEKDGKIMLLGGMSEETGGTVRVGGSLDASAPDSGNGGFVETSGSVVKIGADAVIDTSSANGEAGTWLLDPTDLEISYDPTGANDSTSHVHTQALQNSLAGGNVVLETAATGAEAGDISIVDPIVWDSGYSLTLDADNDIVFSDYLHGPNGGLTLNALGSITTGAEGHINVDTFTLNGGDFSQVAATLPTFAADDFVINGGTFTRAVAGDGTGTPLHLTDIYGLQGLGTTLDFDAVLVNDIDASGTASWNSGAGFSPIGNEIDPYTGSFDGQGLVIDGLTIARPGQDEVGLFGYTSASAALTATALEGGSIVGGDWVGGLVGYNEGSITTSYVTGAVEGEGYVGGLVGVNEGSIATSYTTAAVDGVLVVGGLVGMNGGSIATSYATGAVDGDGDVGGLVGWNFLLGTISASYWDSDTTGQVGAVGSDDNAQTVNEVQGDWGSSPDAYNQASYEVASEELDFSNDWFIAEDFSRPMLRAFLDGGNISNLYQLQGMAASVNDGADTSYTLLNDIDASATADSVAQGNLVTPNYSDVWGGRGFAPVGYWITNCSNCFTGSLDGQGFVVEGLTINRPDQEDVGLFGSLGLAASVSNIGLTNVSITGDLYVGALAGYNEGSISTSYATGAVNGVDYVGGLVGGNEGTITSSYAGVTVDGDAEVGGLAGFNGFDFAASISESYATGTVSGTEAVGGLVGGNYDTVSTSYATGAVNGVDFVGGLAGGNDGSISESYASGAVDGSNSEGGLVGFNTNIATVNASYWDSDTTGQADAIGLDSNAQSVNEVQGDWGGSPDAYNQATYADLDFTNDWFIAEGSSRPLLRAFLDGGNISNLYQLQGMAASVNDETATSYTLLNDIDASATVASVAAGDVDNYSDVWGGRGFAPVGTSDDEFTGQLDGQGFVIDGLTINRANLEDVGLIGYTDGASITALGLTQADITGLNYVGALVGENYGSVTQSYATGAVTGTSFVGGLAGYSPGSITQSYATAAVEGADYVGGLAGTNDGTISQSYATGAVTGTGDYVGGLAGSNTISISQSYATGSVDGDNNVGGLVGWNQNGSVSQSYATGAANGTSNVGGLVGLNDSGGEIDTSFWNSANAFGVGQQDAIIDVDSAGLSPGQFTDPASFASWGADIDADGGTGSVWRIYEGNSAPLLRSFLNEIDVIAYDDYKVYDGNPYDGLHDPTAGGTGAGVRYGTSYAEFVSVFGENGTPYGSDDINSNDLEYTGDSQGAVDAGTYDITPSELWSNQTGYDIAVADGVLTIDAADVAITVTIDDASKEYGESDPSFTWGVTSGSLASGDSLAGSLYRDSGEDVGTYDIHGNLTGDLASGNYNVTLNEGVFTITPRAITISIDDLAKLYGEMDPALTYSVDGEPVGGDEFTVALSRDAGENVGDYAITGEVSGDVVSDNYALTVNEGVLTISPREITVSIADLAKLYGDDDPTLSWAVSEGSLADGESLDGTLTRAMGEDVGDYAITGELAGDVASPNYTVTMNDGLLTINPRPIVISADDLVKIYGQDDPALTYTQAGTPAFDETMEVMLAREDGSDVGSYLITPTVTGDVLSDNYDLTVNNGQLQIDPAALTVTADDLETYWDLLPDEFPHTIDGLTNGDTEAEVFVNPVEVVSDLTLPLPGDYTLTPVATLASNNYTVSYADGVLTLLSSNPGNGYNEGLTSTQLPAREALGRQNKANIYEGRELLTGAPAAIELGVIRGDTGERLSKVELQALELAMPRAVLFAIESAEIDDMYVPMLREFVQKLKAHPDLNLLVEGHTSKTGPKALNVRLARDRAMAVYNLLVELGVDPARLGTKGFDWMRPVADNDTLEGRALNRRAEVTPDQPRDEQTTEGEQ